MRSVLASLLCLALAASACAEGVEFVRVWPGWRDAGSFDRISEYFSERENTARETPLRTQSAERAGFYFLTRTRTASAVAGATFRLEVITPASPEPKTYSFSADIPAGSRVFQLGLTGTDWPDRETHPVAWRLTLLAADGSTLATSRSFLWGVPSE